MNFRQPAAWIALLVADRSGVLRCAIARVAVCGPFDRPDCSFAFRLPFGAEAFWVLLALSEETR
jgi:hypothetical protein